MTLSNDLKKLRKGDVFVCRDGTRRMFDYYWESEKPHAAPPHNVYYEKNGRFRMSGKPHYLDIVRVIPKRAEKKRGDADVAWLLKYAADHPSSYTKDRLRRIAKRLEEA